MYIHWVLSKMDGKEVFQQASFLGLSLEEIVLLASCLSSHKLCVCVCVCDANNNTKDTALHIYFLTSQCILGTIPY